MSLLLRLLSGVTGFAVVMLASSLLTMFGVRALHYLAAQRGRGLVDMLGEINILFRKNQGDSVQPGDLGHSEFVLDILQHRLVNPLPNERLLPPNQRQKSVVERTSIRIAEQREEIKQEEVLAVVRDLCETYNSRLVLPERWFLDLSPVLREYDSFKTFMESQFSVAERASSVRFKVRAKKMSVLLAGLFVVFVNLDSLELASVLLSDAAPIQALQQAEDQLLDLADELGSADDPNWLLNADGKKRWLSEVGQDIVPLNSLLSNEGLGLGWTDTKIARILQRAPWRDDTVDSALSYGSFTFKLSMWLLGLVISWGLVALGPPFWADFLRNLTPMRGKPTASK